MARRGTMLGVMGESEAGGVSWWAAVTRKGHEMSFFRRLFGKKEDRVAQAQDAMEVDFTPRMPEVELIHDELIQYARQVAADKEKRQVVTITPGRLINTSGPLPPPEKMMSTKDIAELMFLAPPNKQRNIVGIGMTELKSLYAISSIRWQ